MRAVFELAEAVRAKKKIVFLGLRWPAWWNPMRWISIVRLDLDEALTLANFQVSRFFHSGTNEEMSKRFAKISELSAFFPT